MARYCNFVWRTHVRCIAFVTLLIICNKDTFAQTDSLDRVNWGTGLRFEAGVLVPIGQMSKFAGVGPQFGLYVGKPLLNGYRFDLGISFGTPAKRSDIDITLKDTILKGKPGLNAAGGLWMSRFDKLSAQFFLETRTGVGIGFFDTSVPDHKDTKEEYRIERSNTFFVSAGAGIRTIYHGYNLGVNVDYFFAPLNLPDNTLPDPFGSHYTTITFSYAFGSAN